MPLQDEQNGDSSPLQKKEVLFNMKKMEIVSPFKTQKRGSLQDAKKCDSFPLQKNKVLFKMDKKAIASPSKKKCSAI